MTETPKCPYCGTEMLDDSYTWICPKCRSNSPVVIWDEEKVKGMTEEEKMAYAREAALHRAEPEMRPLTLEEISEKVYNTDWDFVWFEAKGDIFLLQLCPRYVKEEVLYFCWPLSDDEIEANVEEMGKSWRCWPRKPTPKQMAAEKWEE